jgi:hypothetical protein
VKHVVTLLDEVGKQVQVVRGELEGRIGRGEDTSFLVWFAWNHDLYCRLREEEGVRALEFGMDGTAETERMVLRERLTGYFLSRIAAGPGLGLVFDPDGVAEDYNWDTVFIRNEVCVSEDLPEGTPERIVVRESISRLFKGFQVAETTSGVISIERQT